MFDFGDDEALGTVKSVDTTTVVVIVQNIDILRRLQVNRLVALQSSKPGQHLVGIVQKISRTAVDTTEREDNDDEVGQASAEVSVVRVSLIGTMIKRLGQADNVFRRTLETVPEIDANCFQIEGPRLTQFMRAVSHLQTEDQQRLSLGVYTLDEAAEAFLNGNRFFQRHAVIVGSTGSGKSWTTARLLEQLAVLPNANAIMFDIHGEYGSIAGTGIRHLKVAGPGDLETNRSLGDGVVHLPYWLLGYEDMISWLVDRSDQNAPNQSMLFSRAVISAKRHSLEASGHREILANFTIDSPVPYFIDEVITELSAINTEMVQGAKTEKQGEFYGRLSRFIPRLENKRSDRRLGFMFGGPADTQEHDWLPKLAKVLMCGTRDQADGLGGVKIIDFSEVPSDILPLMVSLVAKLVFSIQQWTKPDNRHPIALFCEEAHLYIPDRSEGGSVGDAALRTFERVAKEGRKYGVGMVVISQRPSEVSRTVLSQCNNFVAMRLSNAEDQAVVRRLLPDSLGGFADLLPVLDTGEALVVGDASLLPSRVRVSEPTSKPNSATMEFWDRWSSDAHVEAVADAVFALRRQSQP